jgi:hypothetical protein
MNRPLRLPKSFERLDTDFEERERRWEKRVPRQALERLPKRTERHGDLANAVYSLAYISFRAGRFDRSRHYFGLQGELDLRHQHDTDLEEYEIEAYPDRIDEAGWVSGDWDRFERHVRRSPPEFRNASIDGHIQLYVDWAILGKRVGAELVLDDLEPAAERTRTQLEEFAKPPALPVVQSLATDDGLTRAYFWLGESERCRAAADRFLASLDHWKELDTKPRHIQLGRLAPEREMVTALRLLSSEDEKERHSPAAARHIVKHMVSRRKDPSSYLFESSLLLLRAVAACDREHPHVTGFLEAFPHLEHFLGQWA